MLFAALRLCHVQTRLPGEFVRQHEIHFKLHEAEVPFKNKVHLPASFMLQVRFKSCFKCIEAQMLMDTLQPQY